MLCYDLTTSASTDYKVGTSSHVGSMASWVNLSRSRTPSPVHGHVTLKIIALIGQRYFNE